MSTSATSLLEQDGHVTTPDLIRALEADRRFRRDSRLGAILHPGKISFREVSPTDSLHILIKGDRVSAHVDEVSPLIVGADGTCRYSWGRIIAHNVVLAAADVARRIRHQVGPQRCNLRCEAEWVDEEHEAHCG
ncbi:MAG: hypothetical protein M3066_18955 [Actinomycetota bacterium]|nr:hypothetical protein [Actinomycetota bacterium]